MKLLVRVMMLCGLVSLLVLSGCGGGGDEKSVPGLIKRVGWVYDNVPPDFSNHPLVLNVYVYYDETIAAADIDSFTATAPDGRHWSVSVTNNQLGTSSAGSRYIYARLVSNQSPQKLPLSGTWAFMLRLKNGTTSPYQIKLHEPGSSADATYAYVYAKDDWRYLSPPSESVGVLGRFPDYGYTLQYSSTGGGLITSTGLTWYRANYLFYEPPAYNMWCWLYDTNNVYLGYTITEYSLTDHSSTGLITSGGELAISADTTTGASGLVDLSQVKYVRFVYTDGAQYAPVASYDYRSVSSLVPVN